MQKNPFEILSVGCALVATVLSVGCASLEPPLADPEDVPSIMTGRKTSLASPAARDALFEGLSWIAMNASNTEVEVQEDRSQPYLSEQSALISIASSEATIEEQLTELALHQVEVPAP